MKTYDNFGNLAKEYTKKDKAKIMVLLVPYDRTSTWIKGADKGPLAVIEASSQVELYDIETDTEVYRQGICTLPSLKKDLPPERKTKEIEKRVRELIEKDKFVVMLGGEHSITPGAVSAYASKYKDLSVLQLDAHADLREEYEGSRFNHACVMARVKEICPAVQVGIRSMCVEEKAMLERENVFFAEDMVDSDSWIEKTVAKLSPHVYVTVDLDVFDPSIMSSTGTPEPGGLGWYPVIKLLRAVSRTRTVVGFDVVELCPNKNNKAPDFVAAKLIYKFLSYIFKNGEKNEKK